MWKDFNKICVDSAAVAIGFIIINVRPLAKLFGTVNVDMLLLLDSLLILFLIISFIMISWTAIRFIEVQRMFVCAEAYRYITYLLNNTQMTYTLMGVHCLSSKSLQKMTASPFCCWIACTRSRLSLLKICSIHWHAEIPRASQCCWSFFRRRSEYSPFLTRLKRRNIIFFRWRYSLLRLTASCVCSNLLSNR